MDIDELEGVVHRVLAGQMHLDGAAPSIFDIPAPSLEQEQLVHQLIHFIMDEDLRSEDAQYDDRQRRDILEMLITLKAS